MIATVDECNQCQHDPRTARYPFKAATRGSNPLGEAKIISILLDIWAPDTGRPTTFGKLSVPSGAVPDCLRSKRPDFHVSRPMPRYRGRPQKLRAGIRIGL